MNHERLAASALLRISPALAQRVAMWAAGRAARRDPGVADVIATALGIPFGDHEREPLLRAHVRSLYDVNLTQLRLSQMSRHRLRRFIDRVDTRVPPSFEADLREQRPALFFSAHYQHYTIGALKMARMFQGSRPLHFFYNPPSTNQFSATMTQLLTTIDVGAVPIMNDRKGALTAMRALAKGAALALMPDFTQPTTANRYVPFFDRYFFAMTGTAILALRNNAALYPVYCERTGPDAFTMTVEAPLAVRRTEDYESDVYALTAAIFKSMETAIRRDPGAWRFWLDFETFTWAPWRRPRDENEIPEVLRAIGSELRGSDPETAQALDAAAGA